MHTSELKSSLVLIAGASSGIGRELARLFSRDGYHLFLIARDISGLEMLQEELRKTSVLSVTICAGDLTDETFLVSLPAQVRATGIPLTHLINNAGSGTQGDFASTDWQPERASIQLNALAPTLLTKLLLSDLLTNQGKILFVCSTASFLPGPGMAVYYATKAYLLSFAESLRAELSASGVSVTALLPGPTATGFQSANGLPTLSLTRYPSATTVAACGYQALKRNQALVLCGWKNQCLYIFAKFAPKSTTRFLLTWRFRK
ncbi:MAG: SDR family NAD(P)-dependent oxidoreductase [Candidatus Moranbacteria bacterium]|jgi:uncharacterized protein|nr:SDR family NAD(P)-dependent oxidoreductase [Candidatus Moranbacteria bacterium]